MTSTAVHPRLVVQEKTQAKNRLTYMDNLRVLMTLLVIMVHTAVTYGAAGGWFTIDPRPEPFAGAILTLFNGLCQSFFMGCFFFLSGYFIPGSIDRKGSLWFWKDHLLRLGIPLLVFSVLLAKIPLYLDNIYYHRTSLSFWEFSARNFVETFDAGPTWFLFALLVFSAGYSLWRVLLAGVKPTGFEPPSHRSLFVFALVMGVLMLATIQVWPFGRFYKTLGFVYLQPAFFPQYVMMFVAGILAYRGNWLPVLVEAGQRRWKWVAVGCFLALPAGFALGGGASGNLEVYFTGFAWQAIFLHIWVGLSCVSFSLALMGLLARRFNTPGRLQALLSQNTYASYVLHPLVLVPLTIAMNDLVVPGLGKFALAALLAISISYLLGYLLRRLPGVARVL